MDFSGVLSPAPWPSDENRLTVEGDNVSPKKSFCFPFSPMDVGDVKDQQESDVLTPKRRLSLNMDDSSQTPLPYAQENDAGYGESVGSSGSVGFGDGLPPGSTSRPPLMDLNCNTPSGAICKRTKLKARRLRDRPASLITEKSPLSENVINCAPLAPTHSTRHFSLPSPAVHSTRPTSLPPLSTNPISMRPSSLPSMTQPEHSENWHASLLQGNGSSLVRHISSPLERMTLMSPTVPQTFTFDSQSSTSSTQSHRTSITSSTESDGYFSEIDVFESDEPSDTASETIKTLFNAPLSQNAPITFSVSKGNGFPCPLPPQRSRKSAIQNACRCSLKRSSPSNEMSRLHQPKRPPLPFMHCSNSQDSPLAPTVDSDRSQLKGRSLLRSQSYCIPPVTGDGKTAPLVIGRLIGDESMPYALPLVRGSSPDLNCISPETLSKLLVGEFASIVDTYSIIDCRYPYEFEGGHIQGAINIWEKGTLLEKFFTSPEHPKEGQRTIYIFHCEFSSKRGPEMCRFLRKIDRDKNGMEFFPKLYYPELYLLEGGYKVFYQTLSHFCEPENYCLMLDEKHKEDLRHFKQQAKSWTSDSLPQSRRQAPSKCRRRTTVNFGGRPKSNSLDATSSGPKIE